MESSFQLMIAYDMFYYVKLTALSIKKICRALSLLVLKILATSLLRSAILKSSINFDIGFILNGKFFSAYDMFHYVEFTALSIKTICRALPLIALKILGVY